MLGQWIIIDSVKSATQEKGVNLLTICAVLSLVVLQTTYTKRKVNFGQAYRYVFIQVQLEICLKKKTILINRIYRTYSIYLSTLPWTIFQCHVFALLLCIYISVSDFTHSVLQYCCFYLLKQNLNVSKYHHCCDLPVKQLHVFMIITHFF